MKINMEHSLVELNDLPDEILMIILKKLWNVQVLYSLIGVDKRLHAIVHDPIFTNHLTLMRWFSYDSIDPLPDPVLDRFCLHILPKIRCNIKWLNLESSSMKRILLATNYPILHGLGLYDIDIKTALSLFTDLISIDKNQILGLAIDVTKYKTICPTDDVNIVTTRIFTHIFTICSNLQYLNFCPSLIWYQRLLFQNPPPTINSSTLVELHISLMRFIDCLCILDGRFNKLHTLHVDIKYISSSNLTNNNQENLPNLRYYSLHSETPTDDYDELVIKHLQRMTNLEKLSLNLIVNVKNTFINGNELKQNIINHMPLLKRFEFYICSGISRDPIYLPSKEVIQHTFRDFKDNQLVISYVDYFQESEWNFCHVYLYPDQLKYYDSVTNNFPGGLFKCVRKLTLEDEYPFGHEFFLRIEKSFPFIEVLSIKNSAPQNHKLCEESKNDNENFSIIKYPYLTNITFYNAHDDYIEQFLIHTKICLPDNAVHLNIRLEQLKRVTYNFTRDATRINCAKVRSLCLNGRRLPEDAKDFFPNI